MVVAECATKSILSYQKIYFPLISLSFLRPRTSPEHAPSLIPASGNLCSVSPRTLTPLKILVPIWTAKAKRGYTRMLLINFMITVIVEFASPEFLFPITWMVSRRSKDACASNTILALEMSSITFIAPNYANQKSERRGTITFGFDR